MRPSRVQSFTRMTDWLRTWPVTTSSSSWSAVRSPRRTPSRRPPAWTRRPSTWTCSRVSRSASVVATERRAKKPPTTTTAIAARLPSMNRATAEAVLGAAGPMAGDADTRHRHGASATASQSRLVVGGGPGVADLIHLFERRHVLVVEADARGTEVLLEVSDRRGARDQQDVRVAMQEPRECDLRGCRAVLLRHLLDVRVRRDRPRAARERRPQREERDERDAALGTQLEHVLRFALHDAERVLDASEVDQLERLVDGRAVRRADPDRLHLALAAQVLHRAELLGQRDDLAGVAARPVHQPQVHRSQGLDAERREVLLDPRAKLLRALGGQPRAGVVAPGADLGDDPQSVRVGRERVADQLVDDVRAVVLGGVDVIDTQLNRPPQHGARGVGVARRPEDAGAGELHRAEADAVDGVGAK